MPARDSTGPNGEGPLTGGGFGPCGTETGANVPVGHRRPFRFWRFGGGRRAFGYGRGRGRGYGFFPAGGFDDQPISKEEELADLKAQASRLETAMKNIQQRINDIDS